MPQSFISKNKCQNTMVLLNALYREQLYYIIIKQYLFI